MMGVPGLTNGAKAMPAVPNAASNQADQANACQRWLPARLHRTDVKAANHTNTDMSTCTTNATRKKSTPGIIP